MLITMMIVSLLHRQAHTLSQHIYIYIVGLQPGSRSRPSSALFEVEKKQGKKKPLLGMLLAHFGFISNKNCHWLEQSPRLQRSIASLDGKPSREVRQSSQSSSNLLKAMSIYMSIGFHHVIYEIMDAYVCVCVSIHAESSLINLFLSLLFITLLSRFTTAAHEDRAHLRRQGSDNGERNIIQHIVFSCLPVLC